jgi:hypothetical protein
MDGCTGWEVVGSGGFGDTLQWEWNVARADGSGPNGVGFGVLWVGYPVCQILLRKRSLEHK